MKPRQRPPSCLCVKLPGNAIVSAMTSRNDKNLAIQSGHGPAANPWRYKRFVELLRPKIDASSTGHPKAYGYRLDVAAYGTLA